jgi:CHASE2 domain-containing sensor protein/nitrogen-specific signal transduction histidine kinase
MPAIRLDPRWSTALWAVALTCVLSLTGLVSRLDNVIYDTGQQYASRAMPADVVLVTIDEQSLHSLGRWPWSRRLHAQLLDQLSQDGAKVIGLDVMFTEPQTEDPDADRLMAQAIAQAGNVVLPVVIETVRRNGQLIESLPLPEFVEHAAALGRAHAELDADAMARSVVLWEGLGQAAWPHFAQAILSIAGQLPPLTALRTPLKEPMPSHALVKLEQRYINFSTAHEQLPTLSYLQVLNGDFFKGTFTNKIVLVGHTASGLVDNLSTPISGYKQPMPGVEFLANSLISMRDQTLVTKAPTWLNTTLACVLVFASALCLPMLRPRTGLVVNTLLALGVLALSMALPLYFYTWVKLTPAVLGILLTYPLWAWRRLDSASHFLDAELTRLRRELDHESLTQVQAPRKFRLHFADPFTHRIEQIQQATALLKLLEQQQRETLAFVSHDIRVPLGSAAAQIKEALGAHHPAHRQLVRALSWTEDFLLTSRVQMLRSEVFQTLDVVAVLHEVADEIYPMAEQRGLKLRVELPVEPLWVMGHADTLNRTFANLLSNALKFSPAGESIEMRVSIEGSRMAIVITDHGPGIDQRDMDRLFKRFSRLKTQPPQTEATGVGLGLYFVQTSLHKHGGSISVNSQPGKTSFIVLLPIQSL